MCAEPWASGREGTVFILQGPQAGEQSSEKAGGRGGGDRQGGPAGGQEGAPGHGGGRAGLMAAESGRFHGLRRGSGLPTWGSFHLLIASHLFSAGLEGLER